jgi:hypothetical protein
MLALGLHLSLDCVKRMANDRVGGSEESSGEAAKHSFLPPDGALFSVRHFDLIS